MAVTNESQTVAIRSGAAEQDVDLADVPITDLVITLRGRIALAVGDPELSEETLEALRDLDFAQRAWRHVTEGTPLS
jgi:hypothetical protein